MHEQALGGTDEDLYVLCPSRPAAHNVQLILGDIDAQLTTIGMIDANARIAWWLDSARLVGAQNRRSEVRETEVSSGTLPTVAHTIGMVAAAHCSKHCASDS